MTGRALETPIVEPSTAVERELVALWRRVLHVDRVGVRDEFTEPGRDLAQGRPVVRRDRGPVRRPAADDDDPRGPHGRASSPPGSPRPAGARPAIAQAAQARDRGGPALFLVHDGDGETLLYLNLARRMPDDVAVYRPRADGQRPMPDPPGEPPRDGLALRRPGPRGPPAGPYLLGGMCAGGTIAFEMALQLRAAGQAVGLVALLDASDARAGSGPTSSPGAGSGLPRLARAEQGPHRAGRPGLVGNGRPGPGLEARPAGWPEGGEGARQGPQPRRLRGWATGSDGGPTPPRSGCSAAVVGRGGELPEGFDGPSFRAVYNLAERAFTPAGQARRPGAPGPGRAATGSTIRGTSPHPADLPRPPASAGDPRSRAAPRPIEVVNVPGGHGGMLQEPHVAAIVGPLRDRDRASPRRGGARPSPATRDRRRRGLPAPGRDRQLQDGRPDGRLPGDARARAGRDPRVAGRRRRERLGRRRGAGPGDRAARGWGDWVDARRRRPQRRLRLRQQRGDPAGPGLGRPAPTTSCS